MKLYGITGGIGMGKSALAQLLRERGVALVDTDDVAREVVLPGQPALEEIRQAFGPSVVNPHGQLDRAALARIVFSDPAARQKLEAILHPRIRERWQAQVEEWRVEGRPVAAVVIPLLFETGAEKCFDRVICVACSPATQMVRLQERGWAPEQIVQRLAAQWPVQKKMDASHHVLWTEGSLDALVAQVNRIF